MFAVSKRKNARTFKDITQGCIRNKIDIDIQYDLFLLLAILLLLLLFVAAITIIIFVLAYVTDYYMPIRYNCCRLW